MKKRGKREKERGREKEGGQDGREEDRSEESHPTLRNLSTDTNAGKAIAMLVGSGSQD